jgi:anti-sigma factor ChrR (cupin superfamily)
VKIIFRGLPVVLMAMASVVCAASTMQQKDIVTLAPSELRWEPQAPNLPMQVAPLWGDRDKGAHGLLIKLPGGFVSPLHAHTAAYYMVVISGTMIHQDESGAGTDKELPSGSYVMQPGKGMHIDRCKAGADCLLFEYQDQKIDIIPATR